MCSSLEQVVALAAWWQSVSENSVANSVSAMLTWLASKRPKPRSKKKVLPHLILRSSFVMCRRAHLSSKEQPLQEPLLAQSLYWSIMQALFQARLLLSCPTLWLKKHSKLIRSPSSTLLVSSCRTWLKASVVTSSRSLQWLDWHQYPASVITAQVSTELSQLTSPSDLSSPRKAWVALSRLLASAPTLSTLVCLMAQSKLGHSIFYLLLRLLTELSLPSNRKKKRSSFHSVETLSTYWSWCLLVLQTKFQMHLELTMQCLILRARARWSNVFQASMAISSDIAIKFIN